ncbi:hypothetical protein D3C73_1606780 [compost metagenome]
MNRIEHQFANQTFNVPPLVLLGDIPVLNVDFKLLGVQHKDIGDKLLRVVGMNDFG